jgi:hypothetical protein
MKQFQILLLLVLTSSVFAQTSENRSRYFIEMNLGRYTKVPGLFDRNSYENQIDFLNGFKVGIIKDEKTKMYVSLTKFYGAQNKFYFLAYEFYSIKGYQLGLGLTKRLFQKNRFSAHFGGEILFQMIGYDGNYGDDLTPIISLNNSRTFEPGIASVLDFNYKVGERVSITANTRLGVYYRINNSDTYRINYVNVLFDPINSLGIKIHL